MIINDEKRLQNDDCGDIMNSQTKTTTKIRRNVHEARKYLNLARISQQRNGDLKM